MFQLYYTPHGAVKVAKAQVPFFEKLWGGYSLNEKLHFRKCAAKFNADKILSEIEETGSSSLSDAVESLAARVQGTESSSAGTSLDDGLEDDTRIEVEVDYEDDDEDGGLTDAEFDALDADEYGEDLEDL